MVSINFEGWFQCRLATNPDPTDEPRGISGYTFALAGEPDLDRIIRFQNPVAPRSHGPRVGVRVRSVVRDGRDLSDHRLVGADVDLLEGPRFESRNRLLSEDRGGVGIIEPFHLRLRREDLVIQRKDILYPADPDIPFHKLPPPLLNRRGPVMREGMFFDPVRVADATGIADPVAYRRERRSQLERDLETAEEDNARAALETRIRELSVMDPGDQRVVALSLVQIRRLHLNGPVVVKDDRRELGFECDTPRVWPLEFWMGGWDADSLCGYVRGVLNIPIQAIE